jgi:serine protease Do
MYIPVWAKVGTYLLIIGVVIRNLFRGRSGEQSPGVPTIEPEAIEADTLTPAPTQEHAVRGRYVTAGVLILTAVFVVSLGAGWFGGLHSQRTPTVTSLPSTSSPDWTSVYRNVSRSTVIVNTGKSTGTGFYTAPDRIVTAAHPTLVKKVAEKKKPRVEIRSADGQVFPATVTRFNIDRDVAVLAVGREYARTPLTWVKALPEPGVAAAIIGAPYGAEMTITTGVVSSIATGSAFASGAGENVLLSTDAPTNPGASGGPLVDVNGQVLGMVVLRPEKAAGRPIAGIALAVPAPLLSRTITALGTSMKTSKATLGVTLRQTPDGPQVNSVSDGAQAEGIVEGDVIVSVDGTRTPTVADVIAAVAAAKKQTVDVTYSRNGDDTSVTVDLTQVPSL